LKTTNKEMAAAAAPAPYILFVMQVPTCQTVMQLASMYGPQVIEVVDVQRLGGARPPWLKGVPTLISRTNAFAPLTGDAIRDWLKQGLAAAAAPSRGPEPVPAISSTEPMAQGSKSGFAYVGATTNSDYATVKESLYSRKKKIGDQDVEAYMRMRETPAVQPPSYVGVSDVDGTRVTM
jgi:hypothetical protein